MCAFVAVDNNFYLFGKLVRTSMGFHTRLNKVLQCTDLVLKQVCQSELSHGSHLIR
jgi:hypothetical protein